MGFESSTGMSSSTNDLWGNFSNNDVPDLGGLFNDWDIGSLRNMKLKHQEKW